MAPPRLSYRLYDLLTRGYWGDLPLGKVNFDKEFDGAGTFSGALDFGSANWQARSTFASGLSDITPASTKLSAIARGDMDGRLLMTVEQGRVPLWWGIMEKTNASGADQSVTINGSELWNFFNQQLLKQDFDYSQTPTDQTTIFKTMIDLTQARPNRNIGIDTHWIPATGVLVAPSAYKATDRKSIGEICESLAKAANGFDFRIDAYIDINGNLQFWLNAGYPYVGKSAVVDPAAIVRFNKPGNIIDYSWPADGTKAYTDIDVVAHINDTSTTGSGSGQQTIIKSAVNQNLLDAGWPGRDYVWTADSEFTATDDGRQQSAANGLARIFQNGPVKIPQIVVKSEAVVGKVFPGDDIRVIIKDRVFPNGIDVYYRMLSYSNDVDAGKATLKLDSLNSESAIEGSKSTA